MKRKKKEQNNFDMIGGKVEQEGEEISEKKIE